MIHSLLALQIMSIVFKNPSIFYTNVLHPSMYFLLPLHRQLTVPVHPFATPRYKARSPFSALGGVGDQFRSPVDLCKNCRT